MIKYLKDNYLKLLKFISLGVTALSVLMASMLIFIPYFEYALPGTELYKKLSPISALSLLGNEAYVRDGIAYLGLGIFIATLLVVAFSIIIVVKTISNVTAGDYLEKTKLALAFSVGSTGLYSFSGTFIIAVANSNGGSLRNVNNFLPFTLMTVVCLLYALAVGALRTVADESKEEALEIKPKPGASRRIFLVRLETLLFAAVSVILAAISLTANFFTATFDALNIFGTQGQNALELDSVSLTGSELIKNYAELERGGQIMAFAVISLLILVLSLALITLVSYLGRSKVFYKLSIMTVVTALITTLAIGLFGQYYKIVQEINKGLIHSLIESTLGITITEEQSLVYEVKSYSILFFLGMLALCAAFIIRKPYEKGAQYENELDLLLGGEDAQKVEAEVSFANTAKAGAALSQGAQGSAPVSLPDGTSLVSDPCPAFSQIDAKLPIYQSELEARREALFPSPSLPDLVKFVVEYARDSRLHLSYNEEDVATFIAGLATTKLTILQGMSGTGKTSLPKIFAEALYAVCDIVEVESSWRDKNELLGYYNEFSKMFTPKKFTEALYRARLNPDVLTFIVLDEMNLSRIEYYFSDFLSLMENEPDKREIKLLNVSLHKNVAGESLAYRGLVEGNTLKIPPNVWFIGTANRDESTFEISDKVYDRAHTMNFNKRAPKVVYFSDPKTPRFIPIDTLNSLFDQAKATVKFNIDTYPVIPAVEKLLAPYNISFGNRIAMQIESFVSVYASCFNSTDAVIAAAVEKILLSKVVSKLELKSVENKDLLAEEFEKLGLHKCAKFIMKLNED